MARLASSRPFVSAAVAVAVAALVVLAGCGGAFGPVLKPLPERPDELTASTAVDYAKTYERRYVRNQLATEREGVRAIEVTYRTAEVANRTDGGYVVHLQYTLEVEAGGETTTERHTANYLVNESVTTRAVTDGFVDPGPDPRNGTVMDRAAGE